ncbi:MAG: S41 family peptidase [Phycisphaerales bacterium]|nr:S41 family peptidase [Phycisphaerales bacterium]
MPSRERFAWMCCLSAVIILSVTLSRATPGGGREDDYTFVRTLVDIQRLIAANYADDIDTAQIRQAAITGMLEELDPFTVFVPPSRQEDFDRMLEGTFKGIGVQLNQLENGQIEVVSPVDGGPAFRAGVMAGDVILKVNGESIEGLRLSEAVKKLAGPLGMEIHLQLRRATGEIVELKMTREEVVVPTVRGFDRNADNSWNWFLSEDPKIAYLRITQFTPETSDAVQASIHQMLQQGMSGLILDLRFNPGGRLDQAIKVVDLFLDDGVIVSTRGRSRQEQTARASAPGTLPRFPLIVLANEHSASASEVVAGALKDHRRALVIGQRTYGKGSVQEVVPLDQNAGELKMTVAYYYLPSGRLVHRKKDATDWGVEPNIEVKLTPEEQLQLQRDRYEAELFHRPTSGPATQPQRSTPLDPQLRRAVDTMTALLVFQSGGPTTAPG